MNDGVEQHRVSNLAMEPLRFVERQEPHLGSDKSQNISAHWQHDQRSID
jgi:hypothetical protein